MILVAVVRAALVILAIAVGFFVFRVGDLGAKAVWADRGRPPSGRAP